MKKLIVFLGLLAPVFATSQGIHFETTNWMSTVQKAKAENKLIFVDVYTSWCGPCRAMSNQVFPKPEVGDKYNRLFINYKIDAEIGEGIALAKQYAVRGYPTYLFIDPVTTSLVGSTAGSMPEANFLALADGMEAKHAGTEIPMSELEATFVSGNYDETFLVKYMKRKNTEKQSTDEAFDVFIRKFFTGKKNYTRTDLKNFAMWFHYKNDTAYSIAIQEYAAIIKALEGDDLAELRFVTELEDATRIGIKGILDGKLPSVEKAERVKKLADNLKFITPSPRKADKLQLELLEDLYRNIKDTVQLVKVKAQYIRRHLLPENRNPFIGVELVLLSKEDINRVPAGIDTTAVAGWCSSYAMLFSKIISTKEDQDLAVLLAAKSCRIDNALRNRISRSIVDYNIGNRQNATKQMAEMLKEEHETRSASEYKKVYEAMTKGQKVVSLY